MNSHTDFPFQEKNEVSREAIILPFNRVTASKAIQAHLAQPGLSMVKLEQLKDFMTGEADEATRELIWNELQDPESALASIFNHPLRVSRLRLFRP